MRSNRRKNWFIKRIALGVAIAAFAAPAAQGAVDEGASSGTQAVTAGEFGMPRAMPSDYVLRRDPVELVRSQHRSTGNDIVAADYGMPRAMPSDYALASGEQIEVIRAQPKATSSDNIEFVGTQPRSIGGTQVVAASFDWKDAGIGAGFALGLVLLGWGAALAMRRLGRPQTPRTRPGTAGKS